MRLIPNLPSQDTGLITRPGFWNAECDYENKTFTNITPAPDGSGNFNAFYEEKDTHIFCNKIIMLGKSDLTLFRSSEAAEVPHNMRIKVSFETRNPDHEWIWSGVLTMYREKTC